MWFTYTAANSPLDHGPGTLVSTRTARVNLWLTNVRCRAPMARVQAQQTRLSENQYEVGNQLPWTTPWKDIQRRAGRPDDRVG